MIATAHRLKILCQASQRCMPARLSAPISQTNRVRGNRRRRVSNVRDVARVPNAFSISVTTTRGCRATARAWRIRTGSGAMPSGGFSGFCGDTSHQT